MNPFSRFFRKKAPPAPPPTLPQRVASLQDAPVDVVLTTALGSHEASLRIGAIRLLPDGAALRMLSGLLEDPALGVPASTPAAVRKAAQERLAQLIDEGLLDFSGFCSGREDRPDTMAVAALCKDPDRLRQLLGRVADPARLARLANEAASSRVRQMAAAAIHDPTVLQALLPQVRGKDKSVYRIVKQKCDALAADRRKAEELAREAEAVCASLERHGARPHDSLYAATLEVLTARWRAMPVRPDADVEHRGQRALERCQAVIDAHRHDIARQAAAQAAQREARAALEHAQQVEQQTAAEQAEAAAQTQAAAVEVREAEEQVRADQRAAEEHAFAEIASLIRLSRVALQTGNTRKAARFRLGVDEALQTVPALPLHLARRLEQLDESLNELKQGKSYVVAPKRLELIEEMEALASGLHEDPQVLAEHIRALQQEWRTINKGIASDDAAADAERFQNAYRTAFKPCQEYFAAQAAIRRENLEARKRVLERLKAFETSQAAESPDYRLVAQVLREAPQEWRSHAPVDREASRAVESEFHQAMDRLRVILNSWHERNEADKRALITQARHLSTAEDASQAIDGVKRLHTLWKETGPVARDRSQALWDEFKGLCDAVFQRREQANALYSATLESAKARVVALCEQVEQFDHASSGLAAERSATNARIREWHAAFEDAGELPRGEARSLRDRFERAISRVEATMDGQERRAGDAAESNLLDAARHIRAYERAVLQDLPVAERETLRKAAESFIESVQRWPKGGLQVLQQALAQADSAANGIDDAARASALRMLCIRCEILSSTPTPPEDESLRGEYQLRLLVEGLGQASRADDQDWDALLLEWVGIGTTVPEIHEEFERRFRRCLATRSARSPRDPRFRDHAGTDTRNERDFGERKGRRDGRGRPDPVSRR
jgi:hypothetical protein